MAEWQPPFLFLGALSHRFGFGFGFWGGPFGGCLL